ncbi:MAG: response regulator [Dokdonella sp.]|uniref:response regulator n=1 Tax=Dokdonella sp. TaxID=2291710 RepID=UPI003F7F3CC0
MSALVLVVEDEPKIAALLRDYLVAAGYRVGVRETGEGAVEWVRAQAADALLLDLMLPGVDGLSICRGVRAQSDLPILMITARVEEIDRLLGLELGADDYICKPFSPREVVARVRAVLRRSAARGTPQPGVVELDDDRFEARVRGHRLELTPVELRLLRKLSQQPGRVYSRAQLIDAAYEDHRVVSERTVDSHIKNLRRKLADAGIDPIASVYGVGYRYEPDAEDASTRST